jgi:hypothetical protein
VIHELADSDDEELPSALYVYELRAYLLVGGMLFALRNEHMTRSWEILCKIIPGFKDTMVKLSNQKRFRDTVYREVSLFIQFPLPNLIHMSSDSLWD